VTRIVDMLAAGVKIGLGSDGGCSNNRVSVFDEMRMCALLQKVTHLNSAVVPAETALRMGTVGGAETLDLPAGRIAPDHYADFVLLDMDRAPLRSRWHGSPDERVGGRPSGACFRVAPPGGTRACLRRWPLTSDARRM
jgi:cytosine/adenosine deaminase-related metal-dependent hydrolase